MYKSRSGQHSTTHLIDLQKKRFRLSNSERHKKKDTNKKKTNVSGSLPKHLHSRFLKITSRLYPRQIILNCKFNLNVF